MKTHYEDLQVSRSASQRVIRAAYKSLVQEWHPDRHPLNQIEAGNVLRSINKAYDVLSNEESRIKYDEWIDVQINKNNISIDRNEVSWRNDVKQQYSFFRDEIQLRLNREINKKDQIHLFDDFGLACMAFFTTWLLSLILIHFLDIIPDSEYRYFLSILMGIISFVWVYMQKKTAFGDIVSEKSLKIAAYNDIEKIKSLFPYEIDGDQLHFNQLDSASVVGGEAFLIQELQGNFFVGAVSNISNLQIRSIDIEIFNKLSGESIVKCLNLYLPVRGKVNFKIKVNFNSTSFGWRILNVYGY